MNQLNNFTNDKKENELNLLNCKHSDTDYFKNLTKDFKRKTLSFFHMNVYSLTKNFDDFQLFWNEFSSELNVGFDILAITETRIKRLSYQLRDDLRRYGPGKIEPTFIEITCSKSTNVIVGCIYKHPTLPINDFTNDFISPLLLKLQKESSKRIFIKIFSLKYEMSDSINNFIDILSSNFLLSVIFLPARISKTSTLIDIFFKFNYFRGN